MKFRLLLLVATLLFCSTGCVFAGIGAGIGSAFPKTEEVSERGDGIVLQQHDALVSIGKEHVQEVRKRKGGHWVEGFLAGGAVDLVVTGVLAFLAVQGFGAGLSAMGGM